MPRNQFEQNGFVMDQNTQKLIGDAQAAFETLKNISDQFQNVANASQFTGNDEDDEFIAEIASMNFLDEEDVADFDDDYDDDYDYDDDDDVEGTSYYGRGMDQEDFRFDDSYGRGRGRGRGKGCGCGGGCGGGCGCKCGCKCSCKCQCKKPELYPCKCRECDKLKAKAYTNLVLGINDLKDAFVLACLAKEKFCEAVDSIQDAKKLFEKARCCSIKYGCKCYCKTRRKGHCRHCR